MTFCKRCGVHLRGNQEICVLCGSRTESLDDGSESEREYPVVRYSNKLRYAVRLIALISVVAVAVSLYIDYHFQSDTFWSLIVLATAIYGWTAFLSRKTYKNIGLMILIQLIAVSVVGYVIDFSTGNHGWMINYVIPFMLIAAQGIITAILIARPLLFRDVILYQLQIAVVGILSVLFLLFGVATVLWPYIAACVYSAVIFLGMFLFADRKTKQELRKRFHF